MPAPNPLTFAQATLSYSRRLGLAILILGFGTALAGQQPDLEYLYQLRDQAAWQQLVDALGAVPGHDFQRRFLRGLALAHLGRLSEAEAELKQAAEQAGGKNGGEILVELAGVQFREKRFKESTRNLHKAITLGHNDPYVFDFLASLYYLDGNQEAAVKYWNRVGKPYIQQLKVEPDGILDPVLLDRALAVSPSSKLDLASLRLTDRRLDLLGVFARRRYDLSARADGQFDLTIQTAEKADVRADSAHLAVIGVARELPFRTVRAEVRNIRRSAVNWSSTFRWKYGNHLFATELDAPFGRNPNLLYHAGFTLRDEQWDLSSWGQDGRLTGLRLFETRAHITSIVGGSWDWSTGLSVAHRTLSNPLPQLLAPDATSQSGWTVASTWDTRYDFLELPEKRARVSGQARWEFGRFWNSSAALFTLGEAAIFGSWEPLKDDRMSFTARAQTGNSAGSMPFDRLFRLGMDRDSNLILRGHSGTRNGLKGDGPMGTGYGLANLDLQNRLYRNALVTVSAGPFLDSGKILGSRSESGRRWVWDTGVEGRVSLLGLFGLAVSYGVDTRSGDGLLFWRVLAE